MAKRNKTAPKTTHDEAPPLAHNPFAALTPAGGTGNDDANTQAPSTEQTKVSPPDDKTWGSKLVLSREKKGRGGKTVTRITGLPGERLEVIAKKMKKSLGCGASVDGKDILLHGALTERGAEWLRAQGAKRVILGN